MMPNSFNSKLVFTMLMFCLFTFACSTGGDEQKIAPRRYSYVDADVNGTTKSFSVTSSILLQTTFVITAETGLERIIISFPRDSSATYQMPDTAQFPNREVIFLRTDSEGKVIEYGKMKGTMIIRNYSPDSLSGSFSGHLQNLTDSTDIVEFSQGKFFLL